MIKKGSLLAQTVSLPDYSDITGIESNAPIRGWTNIGQIVSSALTYVFPIAGILVFIYLIYGGINLMIAIGNEEGIREGKAKITNALIGFVIIFVAYWIVQALEIVLGVTLLDWGT
ncbi:MAG: hypothetical protein PHX72_00035 [Candidatus Shapirobacteria bacterium]|nr:hypothetical protein [Candidatus Shapirobacteria bacterium]